MLVFTGQHVAFWSAQRLCTSLTKLQYVKAFSSKSKIMAEDAQPYSSWSHQSLVQRVEHLERTLREQTTKYKASRRRGERSQPLGSTHPDKSHKFNPSKYSTRPIALKFAYLGQEYNGLEHHANNETPVPTVEEVLWKALMKARLIFPTPVVGMGSEDVNWEGCEYSKCGRTDKGVSAFGQVVGLRVRSNRPRTLDAAHGIGRASAGSTDSEAELSRSKYLGAIQDVVGNASPVSSDFPEPSEDRTPSFDPIRDEINYPQVLNRLLPPDIRVLAWCGQLPQDFSARFSCKGRTYKYFFTQPAFPPKNHPISANGSFFNQMPQFRGDGWLDIDAMRVAAAKFEGLHDFRNFCKVDASKQIENFERRIYRSKIEELEPPVDPEGYPLDPHTSRSNEEVPIMTTIVPTSALKIYAFTLHGSAFLWHQVRHMVAILFLVGQGLESPSVVDDLLDIQENPQKPQYNMAEDAPLVLWSCDFPKEGNDNLNDALPWVYTNDCAQSGSSRHGSDYMVDQIWKVWRRRKMDELLAGRLLNLITGQGVSNHLYDSTDDQQPRDHVQASQRVFTGGDSARLVGRYVPVLKKPKTDSVEVINARYVQRKGEDG